MKILMHTVGGYSKTAGIDRVMFGVGEQLKAKGHHVEYAFGFDAPQPHYNYLGFLKKIRLTVLRHFPLSFVFFLFFIRKKDFDIVHSQTPEASFDAIWAKKVLRKRFKVVVTFHGLDETLLKEWKMEVAKKHEPYSLLTHFYLFWSSWKTRHSAFQAQAWTAVSKELAHEVQTTLGIKSQPIPNAVSLQEFFPLPHREVLRKENRLATKAVWVLFVGNIGWRKGLYYLLRAFQQLPKRFKLLVIGLNDSRLLTLFSLGQRLKIISSVNTKKLNELYNAGDALCVPSLNEPFGLIYLEAMASGIPCIGCKGTGAATIIQHNQNGYLVEKRNVSTLVQTIQKIAEPKENQHLRGHLSQRVTVFSWKKSAAQYEALFRAVLS